MSRRPTRLVGAVDPAAGRGCVQGAVDAACGQCGSGGSWSTKRPQTNAAIHSYTVAFPATSAIFAADAVSCGVIPRTGNPKPAGPAGPASGGWPRLNDDGPGPGASPFALPSICATDKRNG
ncbi:hypothetical protein [Streptomyces violaceusniger]|uniref:Uncharacterized protein n=1 Tax=Streptomyces violaceusniger TaxID=68280 RepID=A0A4D4KMK0_STRVO|nr:hypothetical protein SVIO_004750 [Streptomyces violaceusniger]